MGKILGRFFLPHPPVLIPEVGKDQAKLGKTTLEGYVKAGEALKALAPKNIIIISPHAQGFSNRFYVNSFPRISGDLSPFGHKEVLLGFDNNPLLGKSIVEKAKDIALRCVTLEHQDMRRNGMTYDLDHGIVVPLYFMNHFHKHYKLIPISTTGFGVKEHYLMGKAIREAVNNGDEDAVIIASGDLSHKLSENSSHGYAKEGEVFDTIVKTSLENNNIDALLHIDRELEDKAAQCGLSGIQMLLGSLDGFKMDATVYSYEAPFGVGYLTAILKQGEVNNENPLELFLKRQKEKYAMKYQEENPLISLARMALRYYLEEKKELPIPIDFPDKWIKNQGGVFVSFKKNRELRGCVGTITPTHPSLAEEIIHNAISAGTRDFRFPPISPGEIDDLSISIDILGEIEDIYNIEDLNPKEYGIIVKSGEKQGLLLPNLDGIDHAEEQVRIAREKARISFFKKVKLQRFKVTRYE